MGWIPQIILLNLSTLCRPQRPVLWNLFLFPVSIIRGFEIRGDDCENVGLEGMRPGLFTPDANWIRRAFPSIGNWWKNDGQKVTFYILQEVQFAW